MSNSKPIPQVDIRKALREIETRANEKKPNDLLLASNVLTLMAATANENQIIPDDALRVLSQQARRLMVTAYCVVLMQVINEKK